MIYYIEIISCKQVKSVASLANAACLSRSPKKPPHTPTHQSVKFVNLSNENIYIFGGMGDSGNPK